MRPLNVFIDVGAHRGQTLDEILGPLWHFDRVYAFEPDPHHISLLRSRFRGLLADSRLILEGAALSDRAGEATLYGDNSKGGASLFMQKRNIDAGVAVRVPLVRASDWVREHVPSDTFAVMKLNCEGAECEILHDLIETGEIARIGNVLIDFDIRKVPGKRGERQRVIAALRSAGFGRYLMAEDVMVGPTHAERLRTWLSHVPEHPGFCRDPAQMAAYRRRPPLHRRILRKLRQLAA